MNTNHHGGRPALLKTVNLLKKYTALLNVTIQPFILEIKEISFSTRLFVNQYGQLKAIQKSKLN